MARRNIYVLVALVLVVLLALYWFLLLSPVRSEISETEQQIETERQQLEAAQAKLAQMEQTQREAKRNNARLIELAKMVPVSEGVPSLLLQVQDLAAESGIEFMSISPTTQSGETAMTPVTLSLTFSGTFFDVNDFLYRAERMAAGPGRLLAVKSVDLGGASDVQVGVSPTLEATVQIDAYTRPAPANLQPLAPEPPQPVDASIEGGEPGDVSPEDDATPGDQPADGDRATAVQPN